MFFVRPNLNIRTRIFGKIACRYGYLTENELTNSLMEMSLLEEQGSSVDIGEICMMRGFLTEEERKRIGMASDYYFSRREDKLIGRVAVKHNFVSLSQVEEALQIQEEMYQRGASKVQRLLGILIENHLLDLDGLLKLLKTLQRLALSHRAISLETDGMDQAMASTDLLRESSSTFDMRFISTDRLPRSSERFQVEDGLVNVDYQNDRFLSQDRFASFKSFLSQPADLVGPLVDLSVSGLQTLTTDRLSVDQPICLSIRVPLLSSPLEMQGKVRWSSRDKGHYRTGIMFTDMDSKDRSFLKELDENPFLCTVGRSAFELVS